MSIYTTVVYMTASTLSKPSYYYRHTTGIIMHPMHRRSYIVHIVIFEFTHTIALDWPTNGTYTDGTTITCLMQKGFIKKQTEFTTPQSRAEMNRRRCAETENTDPWRCARRRALTKHKQEKNSKYTGQHSSDTTVITLLYDRTALAVQQVFRCMRFLEISTCPEHHEIPGILGFLSRSGFPLIQEYRVGAAESAGLISLISVLP